MTLTRAIVWQSGNAGPSPVQAAATGAVAAILRAEAAAELLIIVAAYRHLGGHWLVFAALFLVPDISMAGYLAGPRFGAFAYNLAHTYLAPAVLALVGILLAVSLPLSLALIWAAHIAFDRFAGFGLKYAAGFGATHLGGIGVRGSFSSGRS